MTTAAKTQRTTSDVPWLIGLAVLVVIGIAAWAVQLTQGLEVLGVGQVIVWGAYIATFFLLASTAGGLVILAALGDLKVVPGLQPYRRGLLLGALACYIASGFMILMDIGQPLRVLNMILSANLSSPFVWDFASLALSVIITAIYLFAGPRGRWLPVVAAIVAALVIVVEGFILSMSVAGELWRGGMMPVVFLVEGLMAASAITLLAQPNREANRWLRRALLVLLPTLVVLNLLEIAAVSYAGSVGAQDATALFLTGSLAPLFWGQALLGIVVPFVLLALPGENRAATFVAAVLVILGVFVAKLGVLIAGQSLSFMQGEATYLPTLVEVAGVLGIIGLAGLLFLLGKRLISPKAA